MRDVVERARVDAHLGAVRVDLGADAVVLVVGERARAERGHDLGRVLLRLREHERERVEERHLRASSSASLRARSAVAPMSPVNMFARRTAVELASERLRDRRLHQPFREADAQLARSGSSRRSARPARRPCGSSSARTSFFAVAPWRRREAVEELAELGQRDRRATGSSGNRLRDRVAGVARISARPPRPLRGVRPVASATASPIVAPPTPATRSSRRGNGEPEKKTTARSSEASSRRAR